ncbi:unnamed protein product [Pleuronectes platessa]|uniref:Uncharacterized protein n=1 Tax=Pleuronectes platessa TaxID=8262 RepID=A0A9N7TTB1_PLEPL|nr:unnamed protein product [Pleuronectes platessa]
MSCDETGVGAASRSSHTGANYGTCLLKWKKRSRVGPFVKCGTKACFQHEELPAAPVSAAWGPDDPSPTPLPPPPPPPPIGSSRACVHIESQAQIFNTALIECPSLGWRGPGVPPLGARGAGVAVWGGLTPKPCLRR